MRDQLVALAERYDPASADTYLSLYADLTDARHGTALDHRAKEIRAALGDRARAAAFDAAYDEARRLLAGLRDARGGAVFVAPDHGFREAHALAEPIATRLVLDSSPYVRPLARFLDEHESFVLVLLDGSEGAVHLVEAGRAEERGGAKMDLIGRHKKGGMSQARYQRHRQGRVDALHDELADAVARIVEAGEASRIVIAGPGHPKREFASRLPKHLAERVEAVEDVDLGDARESILVRKFVALARAMEEKGSREAVAALREALLRGELATTGAFDVARAARDGRVELLVVLQDHAVGGRKCEEHQSFFAEACACGSRGTEVDVVNEAVEYALRAESRIEFVAKDDFLASVGGVGAILRWA